MLENGTMKYLFALHLWAPLPLAWAMQDGAAHPPTNVEIRPLDFGELNFLHTVDTHGWHGGHLKQGSYSADWGDYITFSAILKRQLEANGQDLILIDSGDRIRGNGLYGADKTRNITFDIFKQQSLDLLTIGNHELYFRETAIDDREKLVEAFKDSYLVGNLWVEVSDEGSSDWELFSQNRVKRIITPKNKIRITAFGMIYDGAVNSTEYPEFSITNATDMVTEKWFVDEINNPEVDVFVVAGHVPARAKPGGKDSRYPNDGPTEFHAVYDAIRGCKCANSQKPIHFFGGDYHIRDYVKYPERSAILASGMYLETIGFASMKGIKANETNEKVEFTRRYIDNNVYSFQRHTNIDASDFRSDKGEEVSAMIRKARTDLNLDEVYGCAPRNYWMSHKPMEDPQNLYKWLEDFVFATGRRYGRNDRLMFMNKGAIRYDFYEGEFTRDTAWGILPFEAPLNYIPNVDIKDARIIWEKFGLPPPRPKPEPGKLDEDSDTFDGEMEIAPQLQHLQQACTGDGESSYRSQIPLGGSLPRYERPLGYVTTDQLDSEGDDTVHTPLCNYYFQLPNYIRGTTFKLQDKSVEHVDIVFNDYLKSKILAVLTTKSDNDVKPYGPGEKGQEMRDFIIDWVKDHWPKNSKGKACPFETPAGEVPEL